jgi:ABC-type transport system substrate-binding protein
MVPHGDLNVLDPIWTTQNMAAYHGAMMYDTLFGIDANFTPQPQMVGKTDISADRKTYTFELRPGLKWHDGTPVTARDCVASLRRWQAKDGAGQHLFARVADTPVVDEKTFRIVLKEPYGLLLDALAKTSTPLCVMMKAEIAATDPNTQITKHIGSGPAAAWCTSATPTTFPAANRPPAFRVASASCWTASSGTSCPTPRRQPRPSWPARWTSSRFLRSTSCPRWLQPRV